MMGVMNVSHPDIRRFIHSKRIQPEMQPLWDAVEMMPGGPARTAAAMALQNTLRLTAFNISVGVDDAFMEAVKNDGLYKLKFENRTYDTIRALDLWSEIMENNWDWAEPGILFLERINRMNPLRYCETINTTNPCGEQPLPPNGACLLGSLNLVRYLTANPVPKLAIRANVVPFLPYEIDYELLGRDIAAAVRAFDNVIDRTVFPLEGQALEAKNKRRMGVGLTGVANALETMGYPYGTDAYLAQQEKVLHFVLNTCYRTSISIAREKGSFPMFDAERWLESGFAQSGVLDGDVLYGIREVGLRNGLLTSYAPTGTISLVADNVSSSIEPVFLAQQRRTVTLADGKVDVDLNDYAFQRFGTIPVTADQVHPRDHVRVLCSVQRFTDSSVSKTVNVKGKIGGQGPGLSFDEFKGLYMQAYDGGAKGCTTFNSNGKRLGILRAREDAPAKEEKAEACFYDPATGLKSCE
jgi:ribonucleoside-diphosphate reductase alpha chain